MTTDPDYEEAVVYFYGSIEGVHVDMAKASRQVAGFFQLNQIPIDLDRDREM